VSVAVPSSSRSSEQRFQRYLDLLADAVGHADRREPFRLYTTGLLLPGERKSVEPMAARVDPRNVRSRHQSLHHFVADADWSDAAVLAAVRDLVLPTFASSGGVSAWIVDETGFPKKGKHSVGVARQYCGQIGKQDNCRVAVSLSVANTDASLPIAFQLYLPQEWAEDSARRQKAGVPDEVGFQTKPEIALAQIRQAVADGVPPGPVLADVVYGNDTRFREGVTALGLRYAVAIQAHTSIWREGQALLPPAVYKGTGRPPKLLRRDEQSRPVSVQQAALDLPASAWRSVARRRGGSTAFALCPPAGAARTSGLRAGSVARAGVAPHRMAERRGSAHQVFSLNPAAGPFSAAVGRDRETAVAHRARLSGTEARTRLGPL
jgi:SRSO17 transposase